MATTITIPDFNFAVMYYAEILESLFQYKRINVPEHTDESPQDPLIQFMRMMALVGHLNNVNIDLVANESTLPTAKLQETVRNMLRLIDYEMATATPSVVDVIYELSKVFTASFEIISARAQVSTEREPGVDVIWFEALTALTIQRTDQFGHVFAYVQDFASPDDWADYTTEANNQTIGQTWEPWHTGATVTVGDAIYFGHPQVMWNKLGLAFDTVASDISGVWEYYDGNYSKSVPTAVEDQTGYLRIRLDDYLGTTKKPGTRIRVMLNETTAFEDLVSQWNAIIGNYVDTTGYLGQTTPSTDVEDYTVGSNWEELPDQTDGTSMLTQAGDLDFTLPQTLTRNWIAGEVNDTTDYWIRFRVTEVGGSPVAPIFEYGLMDDGKQYVRRSCTQGRTQSDNPLGSSTGVINQSFETSQEYFIANSGTLYVDDELWNEVDNFLNSKPTDKHYRVELGTNDKATVIFGDGVTGKVPPIGVNNIRFDYRWDVENNGNVGANTITLDKSGLTYINTLWNPRSASGWSQAEGATEESLEAAKVSGPASLRTRDVALNGDGVVTMAIAFVAADGSSPVSRARAFEEGFGVKTIELVIVTGGGGLATADQVAEIEEYFNGDQYTYPVKPKRVVANQEVTVVNYTPVSIDVTATVTVSATVTAESIENQLRQVFQPEALRDDGITYEWEFGEEVPISRIIHEIHRTNTSIVEVNLTVPASNVSLNARELPVLGTVNLTVVSA